MSNYMASVLLIQKAVRQVELERKLKKQYIDQVCKPNNKIVNVEKVRFENGKIVYL